MHAFAPSRRAPWSAFALGAWLVTSGCTSAPAISDDGGFDAAASEIAPSTCMPDEWTVCACDDGGSGAAHCTDAAIFGACLCPAPTCVVGATVACRCDGGAPGAQRCEPPGTYSACRCDPRPNDTLSTDATIDVAPTPDVPDACGAPSDACTPRACGDYPVACGAVPDGCGCMQTCYRCLEGVQPFRPRVGHVVADPARHRFYASLIGSNTIAIIDPHRPWDPTYVEVGTAPDALALSPDGTTLWVGLDVDRAVRRIEIDAMGTLTPRDQSSVRGVIDSMVVMPGSSSRTVVAMLRDPASHQFVASSILDDGVARSDPAGFEQCMQSPAAIDSTHLFAIGCFSDAPVYRLDASSTRLAGDVATHLFMSSPDMSITLTPPYLVGFEGSIFDVSEPLLTPRALGRCVVNGAPWADPALSRALFIEIDSFGLGTGALLTRCALDTQTVLYSTPLVALRGVWPHDFVRAAPGEFAVVTLDSPYGSVGTLYLLHGLVP